MIDLPKYEGKYSFPKSQIKHCMQRHNVFAPPPWCPGEGSIGQLSLNFNCKVNIKYLKPNFVCLLTKERFKTYQRGFSFRFLGLATRVGFGRTGEVGVENYFSEILPNLVSELLT